MGDHAHHAAAPFAGGGPLSPSPGATKEASISFALSSPSFSLPSSEDLSRVAHDLRNGRAVQSDLREMLAGCLTALDQSLSTDLPTTVIEQLEAAKDLQRLLDQVRDEAAATAKSLEEERSSTSESLSRMAADMKDIRSELDNEKVISHQAQAKVVELMETVSSVKAAATAAAAEAQKLYNADISRRDWSIENAQAKADASAAEVANLNEAMASVHAELSTVQRELEASAAHNRKLAKDLAAAEAAAKRSKDAVSLAEQRRDDLDRVLRKKGEDLSTASAELRSTQMELELLSEKVEGISTQLREQSDKLAVAESTNRDLNALAQQLSAKFHSAEEEAATLRAAADVDTRRQSSLDEELQDLRVQVAVLSKELVRTKDRQVADEKASKESRAGWDAAVEETAFLKAAAKVLEEDKHNLLAELHARNTELQEAREQTAEDEEARISEIKASQDANNLLQQRLGQEEENRKAVEDELARARLTMQALRDQVLGLETTLRERVAAAKSRDREAAQRIVDLSQGNAKLAGEAESSRQHATHLEDEVREAQRALEEERRALSDVQLERNRLLETLQRLEEDVEVLRAKHEATAGQLKASQAREASVAHNATVQRQEMEMAQKVALATAVSQAQAQVAEANRAADDKVKAWEAQIPVIKKQAKEERDSAIMQVHEQRKREVAQARSKLNAVAAALELSQHDLQEQASLSSGLRKQLEELRAAASLRNQAAHNATSGATPHNTAAAAEIASLRRALEGSNQARTDMAAELAEARNVAERRDRQVRNLESIAAEKDHEIMKILKEADAARNMQVQAEQALRDFEAHMQAVVAERDIDLDRLKRRDSKLSAAMARLTASAVSAELEEPQEEVFRGAKSTSSPEPAREVFYTHHSQGQSGKSSAFAGASAALMAGAIKSAPNPHSALGPASREVVAATDNADDDIDDWEGSDDAQAGGEKGQAIRQQIDEALRQRAAKSQMISSSLESDATDEMMTPLSDSTILQKMGALDTKGPLSAAVSQMAITAQKSGNVSHYPGRLRAEVGNAAAGSGSKRNAAGGKQKNKGTAARSIASRAGSSSSHSSKGAANPYAEQQRMNAPVVSS